MTDPADDGVLGPDRKSPGRSREVVMTVQGLSAGEISAMLAGRTLSLCEDLLPGGRREGTEWRCGSVRGEPGRSLGVHLTGAKAGVWADFASGEGGDPLDLVKAALGIDTAGAIRWARDWLGLGGGPAPAPRRAPERPEQPSRKADAAGNPNVEIARRIWKEARPIAGTLAETYLRRRGIACELPASLRFASRLRPAPSGRDFPAMIGGVQVQPSGEQAIEGKAPILGVHRTYLTDVGDKAPMPNAKMMLGRCKGGAVRFGPPAETVAVAEGIETALSITTACPGLVVWAALSTSGMKGLVLPATVATVILCPDGDPKGAAAARQAADRFLEQGRQVKIAQAPAGADLNDVLVGKV